MFFTVKKPLRINGKVYKPCICYDAIENLMPTVDKLEKEGIAVKHETKVFFQSGKVIEKKAAPVKAEVKEAKASKKAKKEASEISMDVDETEGF